MRGPPDCVTSAPGFSSPPGGAGSAAWSAPAPEAPAPRRRRGTPFQEQRVPNRGTAWIHHRRRAWSEGPGPVPATQARGARTLESSQADSPLGPAGPVVSVTCWAPPGSVALPGLCGEAGGPHPSAGLSRRPDALCGSEGPLRLRRLQGRAPATGVAPPGRGQRKPRPPGPEASLLCEGRGLPAGDSLGSRVYGVSQLGGRRLQERRASSWGAVGSDTRAYAYCGHSHPSVLGVQVFQPSGSRGRV